MLGMWDVGCLRGCGMLIYKMPMVTTYFHVNFIVVIFMYLYYVLCTILLHLLCSFKSFNILLDVFKFTFVKKYLYSITVFKKRFLPKFLEFSESLVQFEAKRKRCDCFWRKSTSNFISVHYAITHADYAVEIQHFDANYQYSPMCRSNLLCSLFV